MSGTKAGGQAAADTNYKLYGKSYFVEAGRKGGSKPHPETRYFSVNREAASKAGKKGGQISRRGKQDV